LIWCAGSKKESSQITMLLAFMHPATSGAAPTVSLLQFLPMLPPLAPGTDAKAALSVPGASFSSPVYLPELDTYALVDRGQQVVQASASSVNALPGSQVGAHATLEYVVRLKQGAGIDDFAIRSALATISGADRSLELVLAHTTPPSTAALPLAGLESLAPVSCVAQLSAARLLAGTVDGQVLLLSPDAPPKPLIAGFQTPVTAACLSADERKLYLCSGGLVACATIDLDEAKCSAPEYLSSLPADAAVVDVAADTAGNLYVCGKDGVLVVDETGDAMLQVELPQPATGLCFGGSTNNELVVTAGETVWSIKTNTQGAKPASPEFVNMIDKLAAQGDYRHVGW
jgi:hypothetical protein